MCISFGTFRGTFLFSGTEPDSTHLSAIGKMHSISTDKKVVRKTYLLTSSFFYALRPFRMWVNMVLHSFHFFIVMFSPYRPLSPCSVIHLQMLVRLVTRCLSLSILPLIYLESVKIAQPNFLIMDTKYLFLFWSDSECKSILFSFCLKLSRSAHFQIFLNFREMI